MSKYQTEDGDSSDLWARIGNRCLLHSTVTYLWSYVAQFLIPIETSMLLVNRIVDNLDLEWSTPGPNVCSMEPNLFSFTHPENETATTT